MKNKKTMFVDTRKVGFADWVRDHLKAPKEGAPTESSGAGFVLQEHQRVISRFLKDSPYRGLLLYHGLGSGKSCAAIAAAEAVGRGNVFVMLPASLRPNFENEISKCGRGLKKSITWVSTNGTPAKSITRTKIKGKDVKGSCIVIDEVHNLVSQVVNGGKRGTAIFDALFHARDIKLIVLSGTPIINKPFEVGTLLNLINGPVTQYIFPLKDIGEKEASEFLKASEWVDRFDFRGKRAVVELTPYPFYKDADGNLVTDETSEKIGEQAVIRSVWDAMGSSDYETEKRYIYPRTEEEFNKTFVNGDLDRFVNTDHFKRLALGKVSYFKMTEEQANSKGFPRVIEHPPILLEMSGTQFDSYISQRTVEIRLEMRLQEKRRAKSDQVASGVFRAFSRAVCNFAFDNETEIKRYFPSSYKAMIKEMDVPDESDEGRDGDDREDTLPTYDQMIRTTIAQLERDPEELRGARLKEHSPKFHAILDRLSREKKKSLVYSTFRVVEGIGILELVLKANGFSKFSIDSKGGPVFDDIKKPQFITFDSSSESKTLIHLFNGELESVPEELRAFVKKSRPDFRILFVTQSGAEGINLKEVRQVIITEPHWNEIRVQQVIGRAARVDSHSKLNKKDRVVDVYRFLMEVPKEQDNFTIRNVDKNLSTDQIVFAGAKDKMTLVNAFLEALRQAAIDCKGECYRFDKSFDPKSDIRDIPLAKRMQVVELNGKKVLRDPESDMDYNYDVWKRTGKRVKV